MRPRIQVKVVTDQMKYLEEQMHALEPVVDVLRNTVEKCKTWLADGQLTNSFTDISQQLELATSAVLGVAAEILDENNIVSSDTEQPQAMAHSRQQLQDQIQQLAGHYQELQTRFAQGEEDILALQKMCIDKENTFNMIAKDWEFIISTKREQEDMVKTVQEKMSKKIENLDNQIKQQNKRLDIADETIVRIQSSEENQSCDINRVKTELSEANSCVANLKKHINLLTTHIYGKDVSTDDLETQDNRISVRQQMDRTRKDFVMVCQMLSTRIQPLESLIDVFNKIFTTKDARQKTVEDLSKKLQKIEPRVHHRYTCRLLLNPTTTVHPDSTITSFYIVEENNGKHFNRTTGTFTTPQDGLYLITLALHQYKTSLMEIAVCVGGILCDRVFLKYDNNTAGLTTVYYLKKGTGVAFKAVKAEASAVLSGYTVMSITSLD